MPRYNVSAYTGSALFDEGYVGTVTVDAPDDEAAIDVARPFFGNPSQSLAWEVCEDHNGTPLTVA